jgi:hypothetical protein
MQDHYVAQTYLESFTDSNDKLIPYYKDKNIIMGKPKSPKVVCYEIDGDTNKYFDNPRIIDSYLPQFENSWKNNVQALKNHSVDGIIKYQISGYIAFLRSCTPTAKRLGQDRIRSALQPLVDSVARKQFERDEETRFIIQTAIENRQITTDVDRQFPHAMGISLLIELTARFFYGKWLIMLNETNMPFVTSDNPAVVYYHKHKTDIGHVYVPIAPDIAILISSDIDATTLDEYSILNNTCETDRFAVPKMEYIEIFNDLIIKAAEERILHRSVETWLEKKVQEYNYWRLEIIVDEIKTNKGTIITNREMARKRKKVYQNVALERVPQDAFSVEQ